MHNWKDDPNHIYLYQATFEIDLVDSLIDANRPRFNLMSTGFKILWKRISLKPYNSFPQRLQDQLLNIAFKDPEKAETSANRDTPSQVLSKDRTKSTPTETSQQAGLPVSRLFSEQMQLKRKGSTTQPETPDDTDDAGTTTGSIKSKRKRTSDLDTLWQPVSNHAGTKRDFERDNGQDSNKNKDGIIPQEKKRKKLESAKDFISDRTRSKTRKGDGQRTNSKQKRESKKKKIKDSDCHNIR